LYYYVVAGWVRLAGASEWALRFPSAVWGVLIVPLIYALGRRLYDPAAGLLAALLAGGAPLYVYYSQEARMYTQLTALGLVVTYSLVRALQAGDGRARRRWWAAFTIASLAAVYTHYFAFFLLAALALATGYWLLTMNSLSLRQTQPVLPALDGRPGWPGPGGKPWGQAQGATPSSPEFPLPRALFPRILLREALLAVAVILLGYLPWLPFVFHRYQVDASYWQGQLKLGEALRHVWINFTLGAPQTTLERDAVRVGWGFAAVAALALAGLLWRGRGRPTGRTAWATTVLLSYLLMPVILILILSSRTPKFNPRYLMLASPAFWLLIAAGLSALISRWGSLSSRSFPGLTARTVPHAAGGATANENAPERDVMLPVLAVRPGSGVCGAKHLRPRQVSLSWPSGQGFLARGRRRRRRSLGMTWAGAIFRTAIISAVIALIAVAFILTTFAWADHSWFTDRRFTKADFRRAAAHVRSHITDDEAVLLVSGHMSPVWDYYAGDLPRVRLPDMDVLDVNAVLGYDVGERLADALAGKQGAWLILWQDEVVDPNGTVTDILEQAGEELPVKRSFWHVGVRHFRWPAGTRFSGQPPIAHPASVNFGGRLGLLGHSQGDDGGLRVYWQAPTALAEDLKVTGELVDAAGHGWGRLPDRRLAAYEYPTFRWRPGQVVLGRYALPADPGTPPGEYRLRLSVYPEGGSPLEVLDVSGAPQGRSASCSLCLAYQTWWKAWNQRPCPWGNVWTRRWRRA
jgi:hypothetical protein